MPTAEYSKNHVWVIAANIKVDDRQARRAVLRHSLRFPKEIRVDALETYCEQCRRPWDDVVDEPCVAAEGNEHLRGGPIGVRKKRRHDHSCPDVGCPGVNGEYAKSSQDDPPMPMTG